MPLVVSFDAYNDGELIGQDSWGGDAGRIVVGAAYKYGAAGKGVYGANLASDKYAYKTFTPEAAGSQVFYIKSSNASVPGAQVFFEQVANPKFYAWIYQEEVQINNDGGSLRKIADALDNTWYKVEVEWKQSDNTARARVNDGVWTPWGTGIATFSNLSRIRLVAMRSGRADSWWDNFEAYAPPAVGKSRGYIF